MDNLCSANLNSACYDNVIDCPHGTWQMDFCEKDNSCSKCYGRRYQNYVLACGVIAQRVFGDGRCQKEIAAKDAKAASGALATDKGAEITAPER